MPRPQVRSLRKRLSVPTTDEARYSTGILQVTIGSANLESENDLTNKAFDYVSLIAVCTNSAGSTGRLYGSSLPAIQQSESTLTWNQAVRVPCIQVQSAISSEQKVLNYMHSRPVSVPSQAVIFSILKRHKLSGAEQEIARGVSKSVSVLHNFQQNQESAGTQKQVIQLTNRRGIGRRGQLYAEFEYMESKEHFLEIPTAVGVQTMMRSSALVIRIGFLRLEGAHYLEHSQLALRISRERSLPVGEVGPDSYEKNSRTIIEKLSPVLVEHGQAIWNECVDVLHSPSDILATSSSEQNSNAIDVEVLDSVGGQSVARTTLNLDHIESVCGAVHKLPVKLPGGRESQIYFTLGAIKLRPPTFQVDQLKTHSLRAIGLEQTPSSHTPRNLVATMHVHRIVRRAPLLAGSSHSSVSHAIAVVGTVDGLQRCTFNLPALTEAVAFDRTTGGVLVQLSLCNEEGCCLGECTVPAKQLVSGALGARGVAVPFEGLGKLLLASAPDITATNEETKDPEGLPPALRLPPVDGLARNSIPVCAGPYWSLKLFALEHRSAQQNNFHRQVEHVSVEASVGSWKARTGSSVQICKGENACDGQVRKWEGVEKPTGKRRKSSTTARRKSSLHGTSATSKRQSGTKQQNARKSKGNMVTGTIEWSAHQADLPKLTIRLVATSGHVQATAIPFDLSPFMLMEPVDTILKLQTLDSETHERSGELVLRLVLSRKDTSRMSGKPSRTKQLQETPTSSTQQQPTIRQGTLHLHIVKVRNLTGMAAVHTIQAWNDAARTSADSKDEGIRVKVELEGMSSVGQNGGSNLVGQTHFKHLQDNSWCEFDEHLIIPCQVESSSDVGPMVTLSLEQQSNRLHSAVFSKFPITNEVLNRGKLMESWLPLSCTEKTRRQGDLLVSVQFVPNQGDSGGNELQFEPQSLGDQYLPTNFPATGKPDYGTSVRCVVHLHRARFSCTNWSGEVDPYVQFVSSTSSTRGERQLVEVFAQSYPTQAQWGGTKRSSTTRPGLAKVYNWNQLLDLTVPLSTAHNIVVRVVNSNTCGPERTSVLATCTLDLSSLLRATDSSLEEQGTTKASSAEAHWYPLVGPDGITSIGQVQLTASAQKNGLSSVPGSSTIGWNSNMLANASSPECLFLTFSCASKGSWEAVLAQHEPGTMTRVSLLVDAELVSSTRWFDLERLLDTHHRKRSVDDLQLDADRGWPGVTRLGLARDWWYRHMVLRLPIPEGIRHLKRTELRLEMKELSASSGEPAVYEVMPLDTLLSNSSSSPGSTIHHTVPLTRYDEVTALQQNVNQAALEAHLLHAPHTFGAFHVTVHDLSGIDNQLNFGLSRPILFCRAMLVSYNSCQWRTTQPVEAGHGRGAEAVAQWHQELRFAPVFADDLGPSVIVLQVVHDDSNTSQAVLGEVAVPAHEVWAVPNAKVDFTYTLHKCLARKRDESSNLALRIVCEFNTSGGLAAGPAPGAQQLLGLKHAKSLFLSMDTDRSGAVDAKELSSALDPQSATAKALGRLLGPQVVARLAAEAEAMSSQEAAKTLSWERFLSILHGDVVVRAGQQPARPPPALGSLGMAKARHRFRQDQFTGDQCLPSSGGDQCLPSSGGGQRVPSNGNDLGVPTTREEGTFPGRDPALEGFLGQELAEREEDLTRLRLEHQDAVQRLAEEAAVAKQLRESLEGTVRELLTLQKDKYLREARRRWKVAKRVAEKRDCELAALERIERQRYRESAATRIQAIVRGAKQRAAHRAVQRRREQAATCLQAHARMRYCRQHVSGYRALASAAASTVQRRYRGAKERRRYLEVREAAGTAARLWRGRQARAERRVRLRERQSAIVLQRFGRHVLALDTLVRLRAEHLQRVQAATVIQLAFRGKGGQVVVPSALGPARALPEEARAAGERATRARAARRVQVVVHRALACRVLEGRRAERAKLETAAVVVQKSFRKYAASRRWKCFGSRSLGPSREVARLHHEYKSVQEALFVEVPEWADLRQCGTQKQNYWELARDFLVPKEVAVHGAGAIMHALSSQVEQLAPRYRHAVPKGMAGISNQLTARLRRLERMHGIHSDT